LMILVLQSVVSALLWSPLRWFYDVVADYAEGLRAQRQ
jgi:rod shape-determining protein MreD